MTLTNNINDKFEVFQNSV